MSDQPLPYRAWKALLRRVTPALADPDQHERLGRVDWDVLLVLDACRYDAFSAVAAWPVEAATSPASATAGWLDAAAASGRFGGASVATANSLYEDRDLGARTVESLWETEWVDRLGNVPPEPVLERVDEFVRAGELPAVGHLATPHAPYVAQLGGEWLPIFPSVTAWHWDPDREGFEQLSQEAAMATGVVDLDRARQGYLASVRSTWAAVRPYVARWARSGATVVVTADHGEAFGRARDWWLVEHPAGCPVPPLTRVPFAVVADGERRGARPETPPEALEALGYVE